MINLSLQLGTLYDTGSGFVIDTVTSPIMVHPANEPPTDPPPSDYPLAWGASIFSMRLVAGHGASIPYLTYSGSLPPGMDACYYWKDRSNPLSGGSIFIVGTPTAGGTYSFTINYSPTLTTSVTVSISVAKLSQTISAFATIANHKPSDSPLTITPPTASSGLGVVVSVLSGPATISGNVVTFTGTGTVVLAANQAGNGDYNAAPQVTKSFTVAKLSQTIAPFPTISGHKPSDSPLTITPPTASSGLGVVVSVLSGPATISGNVVTFTGTGTVTLAANQAGNGDYNAAPQVTKSFTVAKLSQTISFPTISGPRCAGTSLTITPPTASSGLGVTVGVLSGPATISGTTVTLTGAGTVILKANQSGNGDYNAAPQMTTSFTVVTAAIALSNMAKSYTGYPLNPTVTTTPAGLTYTLTWDGGSAPSAIGSYGVTATITDSRAPSGVSASGTFVILNVISATPYALPCQRITLMASQIAWAADPTPLFSKLGDDLFLLLQKSDGSAIPIADGLSFTASQYPGGPIVIQSDVYAVGVDTNGASFYLLHIPVTGALLLLAIADAVDGLLMLQGQLTWHELNSYDTDIAPAFFVVMPPPFEINIGVPLS